MPKVIVTGAGSSRDFSVNDPAEAVRKVSTSLRQHGTDASVLSSLQMWANAGFKKPLRVTLNGMSFVIDYRE